jgi:hypothetical protein
MHHSHFISTIARYWLCISLIQQASLTINPSIDNTPIEHEVRLAQELSTSHHP